MLYRIQLILLTGVQLLSAEVIGEGLYGSQLFNYLSNNYQASNTLGYNTARDVMYSSIDIKSGNQLTGVYSGYTITLNLSLDPSTNAYDQGINCEHTWPQSLGSSSEPMKSDMHHLFPTKSNVNSSRGNDPFQDSPDQSTDKWYRNDYYVESVPSQYKDEYAEKYNPTNPDDERFEPREEQKGNTARAMMYFYTIYSNAPGVPSLDSFWNLQKETLIDWHYYDLPDQTEINRTNQIASHQGNVNPYVVDPSLVGRVFIINSEIIHGDVNQDQELDILDVIISVGFVLTTYDLSFLEITIADMNYDAVVNVLDVVLQVENILSN